MSKLNIGRIPIMKGEFVVGKTYNRLWQVTCLGSTYQSKIDNNTSSPAEEVNGVIVHKNTDKWLCIADASQAMNSTKAITDEVSRATNAEKVLTDKDTDLQSQISTNNTNIANNQKQIADNKSQQDEKNSSLDDAITKLNTRSSQIEDSIKGIAATGGASVATAVTYDNTQSGLVSVNAQGAIDELETEKFDKSNVVQTTGTSTTSVMSQKAVTDTIAEKVYEKFFCYDNGNMQIIQPGQNLIAYLYKYGYVMSNGTINWSIKNTSNHVVSSLIPVKAGITYELNSDASDAARPGVFLTYEGDTISVIDKGTTSVIAPDNAEYLIACTSLKEKESFYVRPTEGYYIDQRSEHYLSLLKTIKETATLTATHTTQIEDINLKSNLGLTKIDISAEPIDGYINKSGTISIGGGGMMVNAEISLKPNQTIYYYANGYAQNVSMIAKKNDDKTYEALVISIDASLRLYEYTNYGDTEVSIVLSFVGKENFDKMFAFVTTEKYNPMAVAHRFATIRNVTDSRYVTTQKANGIKYLEVYFEPVADGNRKLVLNYVGYYSKNSSVFFQFKLQSEAQWISTFVLDMSYKVNEPPTGTQLVVLNLPNRMGFVKAIVDFDIISEYCSVFLDVTALPYEDIKKNNPSYDSRVIDVEYADYVKTQAQGAYINKNGKIGSGGSAMYSKPILLKTGETISVYCKSYNQEVSIISKVLVEDSSYTPLVIGADSKARIYTYTNNTSEDMQIALSSLWDITIVAVGIRNVDDLTTQEIENLKKGIETCKIDLDFNFMQTLKPLQQVFDTMRFAGVIHQWGFIGDSLNSGEVYGINNSGRQGLDAYEWSWGQVICRLCGTQGTNFSVSGMMASTWWARYITNQTTAYHTGGTYEKFTDRKFNAYSICLGTNECNQSYTIGSIDDVDFSDYNNNKESFYGYYCKIIQYIREINPSAKIFLITIPALYHSKGESYGVNGAIRTIASKFDNCFLIDLYKYLPQDDTQASKYVFWGHPTAMGYQWIAYVMANLFSYTIENNLEAFRNVPFIGTSKDDGNIY